MTRALRRLRRALAGRPRVRPGLLREQRARFERARLLVQVFYAANLWLVFWTIGGWHDLASRTSPELLWPVSWLDAVGLANGVYAICAWMLVAALGALFFPGRRSFRAAVFAGVFLFTAYRSSFGKIDHSSHAWVWTSFLLVWLPDGSDDFFARSRVARQHYLNAFFGAQAIQMVFYTMAGVWKLLGVPKQIALGQVHSLAPDALALHIAHRLQVTSSESLLGPFVVDHPWLGWPGFLITLYLQTFAIVAAFRPSLHRVFGMGLILFHVIVLLTLSVVFAPPILLLGIFFLASPFTPRDTSWRDTLADLPLIGPLCAALERRLPSLARPELARPEARADQPNQPRRSESP